MRTILTIFTIGILIFPVALIYIGFCMIIGRFLWVVDKYTENKREKT